MDQLRWASQKHEFLLSMTLKSWVQTPVKSNLWVCSTVYIIFEPNTLTIQRVASTHMWSSNINVINRGLQHCIPLSRALADPFMWSPISLYPPPLTTLPPFPGQTASK